MIESSLIISPFENKYLFTNAVTRDLNFDLPASLVVADHFQVVEEVPKLIGVALVFLTIRHHLLLHERDDMIKTILMKKSQSDRCRALFFVSISSSLIIIHETNYIII